MHGRAAILGVLVFCVGGSLVSAQDKPLELKVWPGAVPGGKGDIGEEKILEPRPTDKAVITRITNVTVPTLFVHKPPRNKDTGAAVIVAPGGGFSILAWDLEGTEVANWLNSIGVTAVVLKYRVPRRMSDPKEGAPLSAQQDAQRTLSLVRSKSTEWGLDPQRIGMLGFSAGGHLTAMAATNFDKRSYDPIDDVDKVSCRPDFAVLIYPGGMLEKDSLQLRPSIRVTKETPPAFFAHASNDPVSVDNSVMMYLALKQAKVPAELHVYATGGHGFGLRPSPSPSHTWPQRCEEWLRAQGVLTRGETK